MDMTHTKEDFIKRFTARLKEELSDVDTYNNLYEALKMQGMYEEAEEIEEIARDEFEHAETLYELLEEHGHDTSTDEEIAVLWHKAKDAFHVR